MATNIEELLAVSSQRYRITEYKGLIFWLHLQLKLLIAAIRVCHRQVKYRPPILAVSPAM